LPLFVSGGPPSRGTCAKSAPGVLPHSNPHRSEPLLSRPDLSEIGAPRVSPGRKWLAQWFGRWGRERTARVWRAGARGRKRACRRPDRTAPGRSRAVQGPGPEVAGAEAPEQLSVRIQPFSFARMLDQCIPRTFSQGHILRPGETLDVDRGLPAGCWPYEFLHRFRVGTNPLPSFGASSAVGTPKGVLHGLC